MLIVSRWWDLAVVAVCALVAALAVVTTEPLPWLTIGGMAAYAMAYLALGRHALANEGGASASLLSALIVVTVTVACAGSPIAATAQMVAYPTLWLIGSQFVPILAWNLALAAGVVAGTAMSSDLTSGLLTAALSLSMSLFIGFWISRVSAYGLERDRLLAELRASQEEVSALERQAGQDAERQRVAREIHDTIAQSLTGLVMAAQRATREVAGESGTERTAENLAVIESLATDALREARALVAGYSAAPAALGPALGRITAAFERETGVRVSLEVAALPPLTREQEVVLLRCVQESLANVRKHASASRVGVRVAVAGDGAVELRVTDDGVGLAATRSRPGEGTGIAGMRERVALAGGSFDVTSDDGGTRVDVRVPVEAVAG